MLWKLTEMQGIVSSRGHPGTLRKRVDEVACLYLLTLGAKG